MRGEPARMLALTRSWRGRRMRGVGEVVLNWHIPEGHSQECARHHERS
jgi:hypothetical protein